MYIIYILKYLSLLRTVQYINFQLPPKRTLLHCTACVWPRASIRTTWCNSRRLQVVEMLHIDSAHRNTPWRRTHSSAWHGVQQNPVKPRDPVLCFTTIAWLGLHLCFQAKSVPMHYAAWPGPHVSIKNTGLERTHNRKRGASRGLCTGIVCATLLKYLSWNPLCLLHCILLKTRSKHQYERGLQSKHKPIF